jgi:hypothetical protein
MGLWVRCVQRQYALNRQLITALVQGDDKKALTLVKAGADPNTHYKPTRMPSRPELVKQFFHRSPPVNDSPDALQMVCGAVWSDDGMHPRQTPLIVAASDSPAAMLRLLLAYGANPQAQDEQGVRGSEPASPCRILLQSALAARAGNGDTEEGNA